MELNQYLSMFIDESKEHLQAINDNLLNLEQNPEDIGIVQNIFRSAHTLKGMSATMGFEDLANLTHKMENVLDLIRNGNLAMNTFIFDCLFKSTDSLELMVDDIVQGGTGQADVSQIVSALQSIVTGDYQQEGSSAGAGTAQNEEKLSVDIDEFQYSVLDQSIASGHHVYYINVKVSEDCVLKAARAYMVFGIFENNGEVVKSTPSVQEIEQEKFDNTFSVYYITEAAKEDLEQMIKNVSEIDSVNIVDLDAESLKQLMQKNSNNGNSAAKPEASKPAPRTEPAAGKKPEKPAAAAQGGAAVTTRTIRVDIEKLDTVMNLFSELLIDRVRLEQLASEIQQTDLSETVEHLSRVSSDLQNIVLKLRMVPVDTVFNRFPRMIRDVAKTLDKKVDLVITGAETEMDRTVIDEIGDPLVHLLRNAVDHGIEPVADRVAAGKDETGTVWLRAFHSGNHVFIEIEEDGRGINREKVIKTAVKNGVVTQEQADKMADEEVFKLLFASGFSTADKITDISGRGVGLDVVKTKIESLSGTVSVESKLGRGTKFIVQLPLTLSIISAMLIRIGNEKYAVPLSSILETAAIKKDAVRSVHGTQMIEYRNSVLPLVSLAEVFEVPGSDVKFGDELEFIVIRKGEKMAALIVDEFVGQQEIVLKSLGKYLTNVFAISGATIMGDGQVALIIDTNALIK